LDFAVSEADGDEGDTVVCAKLAGATKAAASTALADKIKMFLGRIIFSIGWGRKGSAA
jgi:hypothetical protein